MRTCQLCGSQNRASHSRYNDKPYTCMPCRLNKAKQRKLTCTQCGRPRLSTVTRKSQEPYICQTCRQNMPQPTIPEGIVVKCQSCCKEFMTKYNDKYCPLCKVTLGEGL